MAGCSAGISLALAAALVITARHQRVAGRPHPTPPRHDGPDAASLRVQAPGLVVLGSGPDAPTTPGTVPLTTLLHQPSFLDVFAVGGCVHAISRGYRGRRLDVRDATLYLPGVPGLGGDGGGEVVGDGEEAGDDDGYAFSPLVETLPDTKYAEAVVHLRACPRGLARVLAGAGANATLAAEVRMGAGYAPAPVRMPVVQRARATAAAAVCTLLNAATLPALPPWLRYLNAVGVGHAYVYLNLPGDGAGDGVAASPVGAALAAEVAAGRLTLVAWPYPYYLPPGTEWGDFGWVHFGQSTALQSCVARYGGRHTYMGMLDADEYPVLPTPGTSLPAAFRAAERKRRATCFRFQNVWAHARRAGNGSGAAAFGPRATVVRMRGSLPGVWRAKSFVRTDVPRVQAGVHFPKGPRAALRCVSVGEHLHFTNGRREAYRVKYFAGGRGIATHALRDMVGARVTGGEEAERVAEEVVVAAAAAAAGEGGDDGVT